MKKHILLFLFTFLILAGRAQAQDYSGVWNPPTVQFTTTPNPNIEYRFTQNGENLTGEIIHKKEGMKATLTGKLVNGVVAGTLKYDKHQYASLDQKFRLFKNPNDNTPTFMHESTKGAKFYGGQIFKDQVASTQYANQVQVAESFQKGSFSAGGNTVMQQSIGTSMSGIQVQKLRPRRMEGFYLVKGLDDPKGIKRDLYFEIKQYPNQEFKHTIEARVIGNDFGITGDPHKRFFVGDVEGNDVTFLIANLYEKGKKLVNAEGSIVGNSNSLYIKSPTVGYKLEKTNKAIAEREGVKLSPTVKVRVEYKFIYMSSSLHWDTSVLNSFHLVSKDLPIALYGTGSIRAFRETSSGSVELKSIGNAPARVFDIPKSRPQNKHETYYFEKKKNMSFGGRRPIYFGFYKFAKDAELEKTSGYSNQAIFRVDQVREFEVSRAALEGTTERVVINGHAHLSNKLISGDYNFGNIHRKVYLHELTVINKLTNYEQYYNRLQQGKGVSEHGPALVNPPYFFFANQNGMNPPVMIAFTVEIID